MISKIKKNYSQIIMVVGVMAAIFIRYFCLNFESFDYMTFLRKWVLHFANNGGWRALKDQVGDYNIVYQYIMIICSYLNMPSLYSIKLFSIIFDFILAWGCFSLLGLFDVKKEIRHIILVVILLLPTVWLNSSLWAQCDSIYVSFAVWSLYFLVKKKFYLSISFLALAFTFKLQVVFIMPLYFILFLKKQIKLRHLPMFFITYFVTCIPALIFGKPFKDIIGIYFNQLSEYPMLSMNAPTFWQMIDFVNPNNLFKYIGIAFVAFVVLAFVIYYVKNNCLDKKTILFLALVFSVVVPFFLPHMHDRYFFMADIFSVIYVCAFGFRRMYIPILVQLASMICYFNYFGFTNLCCGNILPFFMTGRISGTLMFAALIQILIWQIRDSGKKFGSVINYSAFAFVLVMYAVVQIAIPQNISVKTNKKTVCYVGIYPYQYEDTVMVPIKGFLNASGYFVTMDKETGHILAKKNGEQIDFDFSKEEALLSDGSLVKFTYPRSNINSNNCMSAYDLSNITNMKYELKDNVLYFFN